MKDIKREILYAASLVMVAGCSASAPIAQIERTVPTVVPKDNLSQSGNQNKHSLEIKVPVGFLPTGTNFNYVEIIKINNGRYLVASKSDGVVGVNSSGSLVYAGIDYMRDHGCDNLSVSSLDFGTVEVNTLTPDTCLPDLV